MNYELLGKLYYKNKALFESEYVQRKNNALSVSLGLDIHGHEAFYVNTPEFVPMISRLYKKLSTLDKLCMALPPVAYEAYQRNCLIDEVILSNDIEGIRSSRKEIINVLNRESGTPKKQRFEGMVWKYVLLLDNSDHPYTVDLENSSDVRALYNDIVIDEIDPVNLPDGELFRKDIATVISGTQQEKHRGVHPESEIIKYMDKTLTLLKREEIPELCKIAILHYMIGYIHPFYDGNGRLSRFMSSYLLKKEFNTLMALRLSYTIKNQKSEYYKAFDITNDPHNMGDLTYFIIYFARVVEQTADGLIERLEDGQEALTAYSELLEAKYGNLKSTEKKKNERILWYLVQNSLFSHEHMDRQILADLLDVSPVTVQNYIDKLIEAGAPITTGKDGRKFIYKLNINDLPKFLQK